MTRFLIEREIPGASNLTQDELAAISQTSNEAVASLGVPYTWVTSYVAGDKIYCVHEAQDADTILVLAPVLSIPEEIVVSVEGLDVGAQILASDVTLPEGLELTDDPELLIINIVESEEDPAGDVDADVEGMGEDELPQHSADSWAALAADFLEFARTRKPGTARVRLFTPGLKSHG